MRNVDRCRFCIIGFLLIVILVLVHKSHMITGSAISLAFIGVMMIFVGVIGKRIAKRDIYNIELVSIDSEGVLQEEVVKLQKGDVSLIAELLDQKASLFIEDEFEFASKAMIVYSEKITILYPDRHDFKKIRVGKKFWGFDLNEEEQRLLVNILGKYGLYEE